MPRPQKCRWISSHPGYSFFKPTGVPMRMLEKVDLTVDELEAIRLADLDSMSQEAGAEKMNVSRATFGRIVARARNKVANALVNGKAILIEGGEVTIRPTDEKPGNQHGRCHHGGRGQQNRTNNQL